MSTDLSAFPITHRWPPQHPDRLQLYSMNTPNGIKVAAMLEETGLPYEAHRVNIVKNDQLTPEFLSLNPNNKIPAILDPNGPGGQPLPLFESGAILIYLAEKTGQFLSTDPIQRLRTLQWLMFQMGGIGPMFGQLGFFFRFGGAQYEDKRPRDRYVAESRRLLRVLNEQLKGKTWVMGDELSIADMAIFPWVHSVVHFYQASAIVGYEDVPEVDRALRAFYERPAVQRAMKVTSS